jgi:hypothetical protein
MSFISKLDKQIFVKPIQNHFIKPYEKKMESPANLIDALKAFDHRIYFYNYMHLAFKICVVAAVAFGWYSMVGVGVSLLGAGIFHRIRLIAGKGLNYGHLFLEQLRQGQVIVKMKDGSFNYLQLINENVASRFWRNPIMDFKEGLACIDFKLVSFDKLPEETKEIVGQGKVNFSQLINCWYSVTQDQMEQLLKNRLTYVLNGKTMVPIAGEDHQVFVTS